MSPQNRRAHPRFRLHLSAEIQTPKRTITAATRDLSVGGCCVESPYSLQEGLQIRLSLFLVIDGIECVETPPLIVGAQVQWTAENDEAPLESRHLAGMRFTDATDAQRKWLEDFLARASG